MADSDNHQNGGNGTTPPNETEFSAGTDLGGDTAVEFAAADVPMDDDDTLAGGRRCRFGRKWRRAEQRERRFGTLPAAIGHRRRGRRRAQLYQ